MMQEIIPEGLQKDRPFWAHFLAAITPDTSIVMKHRVFLHQFNGFCRAHLATDRATLT
jgi:hypothetical protein